MKIIRNQRQKKSFLIFLQKFTKKLFSNKLKVVSIFLIIFNFYAASYFPLNGELNFHTDIGRDFLLLKEIEDKKFMLIGGSTGAAGVYHGPLWPYLNFPAYYLGNGNPIVIVWFWIFLIGIFTIINFLIVKNLFGEITAYLFSIFITSYLITWGKEFTHPEAALLLMPSFIYTFWRYTESLKIRFLCLHVIIAGLIIQLEIASGAPFFLLSAIFIAYLLITKRKLEHFLAFFLILIPLSSYILFDLRHDFIQLKSLIKYLSEGASKVPFTEIIKNRIGFMTTVASPMVKDFQKLNVAIFIIFLALIIKNIKEGINGKIYLIFLYFFFGFFLISLAGRNYLLVQYFIAFVPIVIMSFLSLVNTKYGKYVLPLIFVIIILNGLSTMKFLNRASGIIGKDLSSWGVLKQLSIDVFKDAPEEFGYFIYSPDKLSYSPKYAMIYAQKINKEKQGNYFQKKTVTYIISAPPALNDPWAKYFTDNFWIVNSIKISKQPANKKTYPNGYTIRRYELSQSEVGIPFDQYEDTGIHFR